MKPIFPSPSQEPDLALPGIRVWTLHITADAPFPQQGAHAHIILFCQSGRLHLKAEGCALPSVSSRQVLLLSDQVPPVLISAKEARAAAVCIAPLAAEGAANRISQALGGLSLQLERIWAAVPGSCLVEAPCWAESVFAGLDVLPPEDHGCYCLFKAVELLHLIGMGGISLQVSVSYNYLDRCQQEAIQRVCDYVRAHPEEELGIRSLARRFLLSPTALKQGFRRMYGKTIHSMVVDCRMERAAELLAGTRLTVLRISQEVGYSSTSHFSAMFRRKYHLSPAEFRKRNKNV